jgi:predicted acylesterase/phospholipase RssA
MSLSFPLLISAVPLHAINFERQPPNRDRPERCWFSDGGITSNFPVHFFDSPVPRWPTFAIDLLSAPAYRDATEGRIWMPDENGEGGEERWTIWEGEPALKQLGAFGGSIFRTAQNWLDNRQMRVQGYRDRIAHIFLLDDEGGMNLRMDEPTVARLSGYGAEAAALLRHRFSVPAPTDDTKLTWDNQRWLRFRAFMELLEDTGARFRAGYDDATAGNATMAELAARAADQRPPGYPWETAAQRTSALEGIAEWRAMLDAWSTRGTTFEEGAPRPAPAWRLVAPM